MLSDGTALAVDRTGQVRPVAQDDRLADAVTVTGGLAVYDDGMWMLARFAR